MNNSEIFLISKLEKHQAGKIIYNLLCIWICIILLSSALQTRVCEHYHSQYDLTNILPNLMYKVELESLKSRHQAILKKVIVAHDNEKSTINEQKGTSTSCIYI